MPDKTQVVTSAGAFIQIGIEDVINGLPVLGVYDKDNNWGTGGSDFDYNIVATGQSSGATILKDTINNLGTDNAANNVAYGSNGFSAHKGILTVSLNASSPSGTQTPGAEKEVLRLDLVATGDDVIVRELELKNSGTVAITGGGVVTIKSSDLGTTYATVLAASCNTYGVGAICLNPTTTPSMSIGPNGCTIAAADGVGDKCTAGWTSADNLTISAGAGAKTIKIFGDTTGSASTKTYQMSVSNAAANRTTEYGVTYRDSSGTDVGNKASTYPATKNLPLTGGGLTY